MTVTMVTATMITTVTLHCHEGNHSWERPAQRGKRPFNCPEHAPTPTTATATMHCANGNHSWERPSQRGKPPRNCPAHSSNGYSLVSFDSPENVTESNDIVPVLSGAMRAERLFQTMKMLSIKTNREVIVH